MKSFPVYILDDETIVFTQKDWSHCEFWEAEVAAIVANKFKIPIKFILNLPYSQRRGRVVGDIFYCGESLSKNTIKKIEKKLDQKIKVVYDIHETRLEMDVAMLKTHIDNNIPIASV